MRNTTGYWCEFALERNSTSWVADTRQPRLPDKNQPVPKTPIKWSYNHARERPGMYFTIELLYKNRCRLERVTKKEFDRDLLFYFAHQHLVQ